MSSLQSERGRGKSESALFAGSFTDCRSAGLGGLAPVVAISPRPVFAARLFVLGQGQLRILPDFPGSFCLQHQWPLTRTLLKTIQFHQTMQIPFTLLVSSCGGRFRAIFTLFLQNTGSIENLKGFNYQQNNSSVPSNSFFGELR